MPPSDFTTSYACRNPDHTHCRACRADAEWRTRVGAPGVCPFNENPPPFVPPPVPPEPSWVAVRQAICEACDLRKTCGLWSGTKCHGNALLNRPGMICPAYPPRWPSPPPGSPAPRPAGPTPPPEFYSRRRVLCWDCCHGGPCPVTGRSICQRDARLRDPLAMCPAEPPKWKPILIGAPSDGHH